MKCYLLSVLSLCEMSEILGKWHLYCTHSIVRFQMKAICVRGTVIRSIWQGLWCPARFSERESKWALPYLEKDFKHEHYSPYKSSCCFLSNVGALFNQLCLFYDLDQNYNLKLIILSLRYFKIFIFFTLTGYKSPWNTIQIMMCSLNKSSSVRSTSYYDRIK